MKGYNSVKTHQRIKMLREKANLSQSEMARKLNEIMPLITDKPLSLEGESGKQIISQLERVRPVSLDVMFAYANIFDVSIDYLTGWSDDMQPEYKSAKDELNFDDDVMCRLKSILAPLARLDDKGNATDNIVAVSMSKEVNAIIKSRYFKGFAAILQDAAEATDNDVVGINSQNEASTISSEDAPYSHSKAIVPLRDLYAYQFQQAAQSMFSEIMEAIGKKDITITMKLTESEQEFVLKEIAKRENESERQ